MRNKEWKRKKKLTRNSCDKGLEKSRERIRKAGSTDTIVAVILISARLV